jgi:hypothetical protein
VCDGSAWVYLGGGGSGGSGPVAAWSFEDALTDDSGNGFALSAAGGATVTLAGHVGSGLSLTGASGTRATVSVPAVAGNPALTVAGWFRLDAHGGGAGRGLIGVGSTANRGHFYVRAWGASSYPTCDTQPRVALGADTGSTDMWHCGTSVLPTGVWTHVAASFNPVNNSARIYVNGALERTVTLAQGLALGTTVYLGGDGHDDNWLDGSVDDAVVYTRALSDSEIAQLYATGLDAIMDNPDFEEGAVGWTATGTAFTGWPHTSCANAGACFGARGITSLAGGESATGTLTSSRFAIRQRYLCWKSGGGQSSFTAIDVDDNGSDDVVVTAYGTDGSSPSFDSWHDQCADLQAHVGKVARVRLVDNDSAGSFAWAAWDSFRAAATP